MLESVRQTSAGILNMATARVIGTYVLPGILERFHQEYPDTNLHIKVGPSAEVLQMVVEEEVQLGLARFMQHPDIESRLPRTWWSLAWEFPFSPEVAYAKNWIVER